MHRGYADTTLGQIHYVEAGTGPPIVLLHQTASSSVMYERAMPLLAAGHRAVAIDTPGFGMSDGPAGPEGVIEHYAEAVVGVMDHLGIEAAHVVGFHTGATTAVELASAHADRVQSLVIFCVLALASDDERAEWLSRADLATEWVPDGEGRFLETDIVDYVAHFATPDDGETYLRELIAKLQAGPEYCWAYEGVARYDHYANYAKLRCPTLVLNAENEVLHSYTELAHAAIAHSEYQVIPGPEPEVRGWVAVVPEYPAEFADAITGFVERVELGEVALPEGDGDRP